jgi:predicted lipoprotein with Yx(FWY)xxD motif
MQRMKVLIALAALGTLAAACGDNGSGGAYGGGTTGSSAAGGATSAAEVGTAKVGDLGTVLVDGNGMTLYLFENDTGSTSTCTDTCAGTWPALTTSGEATATSGADASQLGTTTRDDGTTQVTYGGHPLYRYSGDSAAGQANGQEIGDVWYAVTTQGTPAGETDSGGESGGGDNQGGGYGNGYGG